MDDSISSFPYYYYSDDNSTSPPPTVHPLTLGASVTVVALSCLGVVGNLCLMHAVLRYKHMRTAPNILIFNLAAADLLYILITTPIYVEHEFNSGFEQSSGVCKLQHGLAFLAQYASALALAALSRERYTAIACGMEARQRGGSGNSCADTSKGAVACVWSGACLLAAPTFFFAGKRHGDLCTYSPQDTTTKRVFDCLRFSAGYVIPLTVVAYFYLKLAVSLVRSSQRLHNECVTEAMVYQTKVRKRLAVAVLVITIFFAFCWFPHFYYYLLITFNNNNFLMMIEPFPTAVDVYRYVGLLGPIVNTCLDPWLLFVISSRHRACLLRCFNLRARRPTTAPSGHTSGVRMVTFRRHKFSAGTGTSISRLSRV